jgi:pimeloyl-ACP methyl ester carboxylesterase
LKLTALFKYKEFALEYTTIGNGEKTIFYFHGYGKSLQEFYDYEFTRLNEFTVYAFNFFHHGNSVYPSTKIHTNTLTKEEFSKIIGAFIHEKSIDKFGLIGYSMGGKICLNILEIFPEKTSFIVLSAPDGIKKNFWYLFTSKNKLGNRIYKKGIENPKSIFNVINFFKRWKFIDEKMANFAIGNLETKEKRLQVYTVWMTMRNLEPKVKTVISLIKKYKIPVCLNYGRYDKVITHKKGLGFAYKTQPFSTFNFIEKGHNLPVAETGKKIEEFILGISR